MSQHSILVECIIDMMGEVRLGLWAEDVGNEPFKAKGFGGKQKEKLLQISQWVEIVNVGQKNSQRSVKGAYHQEVAQKESTRYNFLYSLSFASSSWKFVFLICPSEYTVLSMSGVQMKDEMGSWIYFQGHVVNLTRETIMRGESPSSSHCWP